MKQYLLATISGGTFPTCRGLWLALAVLSFCGCTSVRDYVRNGFKVGPNYAFPGAETAEDWIDGTDVRLRKDSDGLERWWAVFNDPALDIVIGQARAQSLTLQEAGFRILQARAARNIAAGNLFPQQQSVSEDYLRNVLSKNAANTLFLPQRYFSQWDAGFNLSWEVDFWGRYRRAVEAADGDLSASVENYNDVWVTLLGDVASAYVQIRTFEQSIELARENVKLQAETLKIAEARFKGGQTSELDVDQAKSDLAVTEALVHELEISLRQANNQLCILLGMPTVDLKPRIGAGSIPAAPPTVAVGIPAELLMRRPDIRRAEREAAAQCARIGVAVSELYPHLSVTGAIGLQSERFSDLVNYRSLQGNSGPSFQWNVLNYGRLVNNIRLQDARFQELVTKYQNTVLRAHAEVENGLVAFLQGQERVKALAASVDAALRAVKLVLVQYRGGTVDFNRVALLQQNLVQQQESLASAQGAVALGLIQAYRALGGGWQLPDDSLTPAAEPVKEATIGPPVMPETLPLPRVDEVKPEAP